MHRLHAVQAAVQAAARGMMAVQLGAVQPGHIMKMQLQKAAIYSAAAAAQCSLQGGPSVLPALCRVLYRLGQQYTRQCTQELLQLHASWQQQQEAHSAGRHTWVLSRLVALQQQQEEARSAEHRAWALSRLVSLQQQQEARSAGGHALALSEPA